MAKLVLLSIIVTSVLASQIHKRSDDFSLASLAADVANMANQMSSMTAQLTALQNQVTSQQASLDKVSREVGFYAWSNGDHFHPIMAAPGNTLVIGHVITNVGGGYDGDTGFFTAPVAGMYQFHATFMGHPSNLTYVHANVVAEGHVVSSSISDSRTGYYDNVGMHPLVHVNSGGKVHVVNGDASMSFYYSGSYTTFAGFLVKAD